MESATITNRTLDIAGMTGDECVQKVTGALKAATGVTTKSVKVGSATIGADAAGCSDACSRIEGVGYKAREHMGPADTKPAPAPAAAYGIADDAKPADPKSASQAAPSGPKNN
jgi:copper chaperone CopZ